MKTSEKTAVPERSFSIGRNCDKDPIKAKYGMAVDFRNFLIRYSVIAMALTFLIDFILIRASLWLRASFPKAAMVITVAEIIVAVIQLFIMVLLISETVRKHNTLKRKSKPGSAK